MNESQPTQLITAIAELWKLAAVIALPITAYFLRGPLAKLLPNIRRIKRGKTEIELGEPSQADVATKLQPDSEAPPSEETRKFELEEKPQEDEPEKVDSLRIQLMQVIIARDLEAAEKLFLVLIEKEPDKKKEHEVLYYALKCRFLKDSNATAKLEKFANDEEYAEYAFYILNSIGYFYETTDQHKTAISYYEKAATKAVNPLDRSKALASKANVLSKFENPESALELLYHALKEFENNESLAILYSEIANIHRSLKNDFECAIALEKVAEFNATDDDSMFKAAYSQSHSVLPHLSLYNYLRVLKMKPDDSMARNNYGVQLSEQGLPIKSVEQYRRAQKLDNTLSMANLAYVYLNNGMADEAEQILREAQAVEDYHGNVDSALTTLSQLRYEEEEKFKDMKRWGETYQKVLRAYAEARFVPSEGQLSFEGKWATDAGDTIKILQDGINFNAEWGSKGYRKKISGTQINHSGKLELYEEQSNLYSILDERPNYSNPQKAIAYISSDGANMEILTIQNKEPNHIALRRIQEDKPDSNDVSAPDS